MGERLLVENGITIPAQQTIASPPPAKLHVQETGINEHSDKDAKIAMFRGLFRGREDVYAVRTRFKSGDWGMSRPRFAIGRRCPATPQDPLKVTPGTVHPSTEVPDT